MRDLTDAPEDEVAAERARVATEGWGARLLAARDPDGQWMGGACFPGRGEPPADGSQPWTSTLPVMLELRAFGLDPASDPARQMTSLVAANCRWEYDDLRFFDGEVEPCINGHTVTLGAYFGADVEGIVSRLLDDQLRDGGWNCEAERGATVSSFHSTICVLEGLLEFERHRAARTRPRAARRRGQEYLLEDRCSDARAPARCRTTHGCSSRSRRDGTMTSCAGWSTSGGPISRTRGLARRSSWCAASVKTTAPGSSRTPIRARCTSLSKTATVAPAAGTRYAPPGARLVGRARPPRPGHAPADDDVGAP